MSERGRGPSLPDEPGFVGGVPLDIFAIPHHKLTEIQTRSGRTLITLLTPSEIEIFDKELPQLGFEFEFNEFPDPKDDPSLPNPPNTVEAQVKTEIEGEDGTVVFKHPDLHAGRLFDAALDYFEGIYGRVNGVNFHFDARRTHVRERRGAPTITIPASRNYREYMAELDMLIGKGAVSDEELKAASRRALRATWAWKRVLKPHGFTHIVFLENFGDEIKGETIIPAAARRYRPRGQSQQ